MVTIRRAAIAAALIWALPAFGQPAQDQNHDARHPERGATGQQLEPPASPAPGAGPRAPGTNMMGGGNANPGYMMGGNMMGMGPAGMMSMMNMMMGMRAVGEHVEGRIAFIKAELKITDAQAPQWNAFADAVRGSVSSTMDMGKSMTAGQGGASTLPDRLALEVKVITAHLAALKQTEDAVAQLYRVLTDDQKKVADTIVIGPMGMPMGMM